MAALTIIEGPKGGETFQLHADAACAVHLGRNPSSDVFIDDASASRDHAVVRFDGTCFVVSDLNSSNGTRVNGERIATRALADGDVIELGRTRLRFEREGAGDAGADISCPAPAAATPRPSPEAPKRAAGRATQAINGDTRGLDVSAGLLGFTSREVDASVSVDDKENLLELAIDFDSLEFGKPAAGETQALEKERKKLRTIYKVAQDIGTLLEQDQLLEAVMDTVFDAFPQADRGFIMLRSDDDAGGLVPKAVRTRQGRAAAGRNRIAISRTVVRTALEEGKAILSSDAAHDDRFSAMMSVVSLEIRSMMCVPLAHGDERLGVIHLDTTHQGERFSQDDLSLLQGIARQAAMAVKISRLVRAIEAETSTRTSLQRYLAPALVEQVMSREVDFKLGGAVKHGTVFFSDIIGFTRMSSQLPPDEVVARLNRYFHIMVGIIFDYGGMVNKFGGDSILAIWGLTNAGAGSHTRAVEAAVRMQAAVFDFNFQLVTEGRDPIWMGIGLNTGSFIAGNIGSEKQMEYTIIGDEVNLTARIESKAPRGMVYISQSTFDAVKSRVAAVKMPPTRMKGIAEPVTMYAVRGCAPVGDKDTDTPVRRLYLCIPGSIFEEGSYVRAFLTSCRFGPEGLSFDVHVKRAFSPGTRLELRPFMPELPEMQGFTAEVTQVVEKHCDQSVFYVLNTKVLDASPLLSRMLIDREVLESSVDPDSIPRS